MNQPDLEMHPPIELQHLINAFRVMRESVSQVAITAQATAYFNNCERNPQFCACLMKLFNEANDPALKTQTLSLLKNVIKRNWIAGRGKSSICFLKQQIKVNIRNGVLELYKIYWKDYYKIFNQIFKTIAWKDFPENYPSLYQFIIQVLNTIASYNLQQILSSNQLLPYLSTMKKVVKEYGSRRISHNEQVYRQYLEPILKICGGIFEKIGEVQKNLSGSQQQIEKMMLENLFECSRKIDKIIIYTFQCITPQMQQDALVVELYQRLTTKLTFLLGLQIPPVQQGIQKNIMALVGELSKSQAHYPFISTSFLGDYLNLMVNILFNMNFSDLKTINTVIKANKRPLITYSYYCTPQQFRQSIYSRKSQNNQTYQKEQDVCYQKFMEIYGQNCQMMVEKIITELMVKFKRENDDDQLIFEDAETTNNNINEDETQTFQLILQLLKQVIQRFQEQLKPFFDQIYDHLLNSIGQSNQGLTMAMHETILLFPKLSKSNHINIQMIYAIMQKLYSSGDLKIFPRYIRNYHTYFSVQTLRHSFQILASIVSEPNNSPQVVYQCSVCLMRLMNVYEEESLPLQNLGPCLANIFKLMVLYRKDPNHLWNLLNLINHIIKSLSNEVIIMNLSMIMENINVMIEFKDNTIIVLQAITDLLSSILQILALQNNPNYLQIRFQSNQLCLKHIEIAFPAFMKSQESLGGQPLFQLWLLVMKNHDSTNSTQQFNEKLISMYHNLQENVREEDPILLCQLVEQYILSQLFKINQSEMTDFFHKIRDQHDIDHQHKPLLALYSVYLTYCLITNSFIPQIALYCMRDIQHLSNKVSPTQNGLRNQLMMILGHHVITYKGVNIFQLFSSTWQTYAEWFWPIVCSLDKIGHIYACKVMAIALFDSFECFSDQLLQTTIEGHYPIDKIVKFFIGNLQSISIMKALTSYRNNVKMILHPNESLIQNHGQALGKIGRKIQLHINKEWSELNLRNVFKEKLGALWTRWDWGADDVEERFSKDTAKKILEVLN